MTRIKRTDIIIIAVILAFSAFVAVNILFSSKHSGASSYSDKVTDYTDYNGKKIGIKTSSAFEEASFTLFPDSEYYYYDSTGDLTAALVSNKIDAFLEDEPVARRLRIENSSVSYLKKPLIEDDYSFAFTKANPLSEKYVSEFNKMLTEMKENGELEQLKDKWTGSSDPETTSEKYDLTGENGTIKVSLLPDVPQFTYLNNDAPVGYAVDLINIFAEKYGYSLEFEYGNAAACFAGLGTGKYDVLIGPVSVTEERKENMYFTDTIYNGGSMLVLRADEIVKNMDHISENQPYIKTLQKQISQLDVEIERYQKMKTQVYTHMLDEVLTMEESQEINRRYTVKLDAAKSKKKSLMETRAKLLKEHISTQPWIETFRRCRNIEKLERSIAVALIDRIIVYDKDRVSVELHFQDEMRKLIALSGIDTGEVAE